MSQDPELKEVKEDISEIRQVLSKIEYVIEEVIVGLRGRIQTLEDFKDHMTEQVHTSCELKTEEISDGDNKVLYKSIGAVLFLFGLFVGALVYFNAENQAIEAKITSNKIEMLEKLNNYHIEMVRSNTKNTTKLDNMITILEKLDKHKHPKSK